LPANRDVRSFHMITVPAIAASGRTASVARSVLAPDALRVHHGELSLGFDGDNVTLA
jgi:hypothetical protein